MGIVFYQLPPSPANEARREMAVEMSGALLAREDVMLCEIVAEARRRFHVVTAAISIVHGDYQHMIAAAGMPTGLYSRRTSLCAHAIAEDAPVFEVSNVAADARFAGNPWVNGDEGRIGFYAAALLRDGDGRTLGALCITDTVARRPMISPERVELLRLAGQARDRLERLRSRAEPLRSAAIRA